MLSLLTNIDLRKQMLVYISTMYEIILAKYNSNVSNHVYLNYFRSKNVSIKFDMFIKQTFIYEKKSFVLYICNLTRICCFKYYFMYLTIH